MDGTRKITQYNSELDDTFEIVETPQGFKNVKLYPHQKTVVAALLDIELNRKRKYEDSTIYTNAMVLAEPLGSGKTFEILALILYSQVPPAYPTNLPRFHINDRRDSTFVNNENNLITRRYTGDKALLYPNLIVVGNSVILQWKNAIESYTNLTYFVIADNHSLNHFIKLHKNGHINKYNIVLLKNGFVTGHVDYEGYSDSRESMITVMSKITKYNCWSRVIYDDFDTINIPNLSRHIFGLFTIYVSSTQYYKNIKEKKSSYESINDVLLDNPIIGHKDDYLFKFGVFTVKCRPDFVENSTRVTKVEFYQYLLMNPHDNQIRFITLLSAEEENSVAEMLNGEAYETAAKTLGIKTNSLGDMFQRILGEKYKKYLDIVRTINYIKNVDLSNLPIVDVSAEPIINALRHYDTSCITFKTHNLENRLEGVMSELIDAKNRIGVELSRFFDNAHEGSCQVCLTPYNEVDVFIMKCCGVIICGRCTVESGDFGKRGFKHQITMESRCTNCKKLLDIRNKSQVIFIPKEFDIESLSEDDLLMNPTEESDEKPRLVRPKLDVLLDIINGRQNEEKKRIDITIPSLLEGTVDIPQMDGPRKVLLFANYDESLQSISEFLHENKIKLIKLQGTFRDKNNQVNEFKESDTSVMLINSQNQCAGLNIQFATDIVYYHKFENKHVEAQVAGRAQRIGRKSNLQIHYLCYQNERLL